MYRLCVVSEPLWGPGLAVVIGGSFGGLLYLVQGFSSELHFMTQSMCFHACMQCWTDIDTSNQLLFTTNLVSHRTGLRKQRSLPPLQQTRGSRSWAMTSLVKWTLLTSPWWTATRGRLHAQEEWNAHPASQVVENLGCVQAYQQQLLADERLYYLIKREWMKALTDLSRQSVTWFPQSSVGFGWCWQPECENWPEINKCPASHFA